MILRCSTHDAEHARWVVEQARLGELDKEKAGAFLFDLDDEGGVLMSLLAEEVQKEVSTWNKTKTLEAVPFLTQGDFLPWLYQEAADGRWTIISYFLFDNISSAMSSFTRTEKTKPFSRWEKESVFAALTKEEVAGREVFVPRRKKCEA